MTICISFVDMRNLELTSFASAGMSKIEGNTSKEVTFHQYFHIYISIRPLYVIKIYLKAINAESVCNASFNFR